MADKKDTDIGIYGRLYRITSDKDGQYIVHADQVEGLQTGPSISTALAGTDYHILGATSTSSSTLSYNSSVKFNGTQIKAGSFNAVSDARLKENFEPLKIEKSILDLPTYKFDFIDGSKNQIGCKAQDLQEICPEIVDKGSDGYLSIQESKIVYLLIDELKKLKAEVTELKCKLGDV